MLSIREFAFAIALAVEVLDAGLAAGDALTGVGVGAAFGLAALVGFTTVPNSSFGAIAMITSAHS
jgi:hypothetical protein